MKRITRRDFGRQTLAAAGTAMLALNSLPSKASDRPVGSNETLRVGLAGLGIRGKALLRDFGKVPGVAVSAVLDPDRTCVDFALDWCQKQRLPAPQAYQEFRYLADRPDLDILAVASPNHWHALMAVQACQAGKDVYLEKPCSQFLSEGNRIIEAASRYRKIVQHGTHRRSCPRTAAFIGAVRKNTYGKPVAARVYCNKPRGSVGFLPNKSAPEYLNWDQWVGPSEFMPYRENLHPYQWHWNWNFGNGEIGNNGVHFLDLIRWALDVDYPQSALAFGARYVPESNGKFTDQGETPNLMVVVYDLDGLPLVYQSTPFADKDTPWPPFQMAEIHTEQGILRSDTFRFTPYGKDAAPVPIKGVYDKPRRSDFNPNVTVNHIANFIDCVRNRAASELNAPIEQGHRSTAVCHLANASYRTGRPASPEEIRKAIGDHPLVNEAYDFTFSNLAAALPSLKAPDFVLGSRLRFDPASQSYGNHSEANELLERKPNDRPYALPDPPEIG